MYWRASLSPARSVASPWPGMIFTSAGTRATTASIAARYPFAEPPAETSMNGTIRLKKTSPMCRTFAFSK